MFKNVYTTQMSGNSKALRKRFEKITAKPVRLRWLLSMLCMVTILTVFALGTIVMAQIENDNSKYTLDITNNGEIIELENKPFIENGEVYVPLHELFTKLGLMESENAKIELKNNIVLISLCQKNLNEDVIAEYTSYLYKVEIGKSELVVNPEVLMVKNTPDEVTSVVEPMDNAPILNGNIVYVPFSYAERMAERADYGYLSPPDLYNLEFKYSGATLSITYPIKGYYEITQKFGKRVHPITGEERFHNGLDFKAEEGTPVYAGIDGEFEVDYDDEKGAYVTISGENGVEITYCNLDISILAEPKRIMRISKGDILGNVGNTGTSVGAHLHMEVKVNGEDVNPELYFETNKYNELIAKIATDIPRILSRTGYINADYKIIDIDYAENMALIKVEILNYDNKILSIVYDYVDNSPYGWSGFEAPEYWNNVNFGD